jgi:hypothetical protein
MGEQPHPRRLPKWLVVFWLFSAPIGLIFALRILWEKTWLTARDGEQMIGFSIAHIHPLFFIAGVLSTIALAIWSLPAFVYMVRAKLKIPAYGYLMVLGSGLAIAAIFLPDNLGLSLR